MHVVHLGQRRLLASVLPDLHAIRYTRGTVLTYHADGTAPCINRRSAFSRTFGLVRDEAKIVVLEVLGRAKPR